MTKQRIEEQSRQKKEYWEGQMKGWEQSGMSQAGYCSSRNINLKTFSYWRRKLKEPASGIRLIQIPADKMGGKRNPQAGLKLLVDGKYEIEISERFSPSTLREVLKAVKGV